MAYRVTRAESVGLQPPNVEELREAFGTFREQLAKTEAQLDDFLAAASSGVSRRASKRSPSPCGDPTDKNAANPVTASGLRKALLRASPPYAFAGPDRVWCDRLAYDRFTRRARP
jgi:hypothetical protein